MRKVHVRRTKRLHEGHLWIFSNEIAEQVKDYEPGSLVEVYDMHETFQGSGYINPHSLIAVRLLTWKREPLDREFFKRRIEDAVSLRERFFGGRNAVRLIYSEGDYMPGLIVDRYASHLSVQILTAGMERMKETILGLLDEILRPDVIVLKNEGRSRVLEGLMLYKEVVKGEAASRAIITEGSVRLEVDPYAGQKTGFFLDQKENRRVFGKLVSGGKGLDLFCYTGAWALTAAASGASVTGVDESRSAIDQAERNAALNSFAGTTQFVEAEVFSFLRGHLQGNENTCDFIVLDPPAFVKSAAKLKEAVKAYRELNAICMRLLKRGGLLVTSSCSYHLGRELFVEMLRAAGKDAGRGLRLLELRSQDRDHPVLLSMPETEYLKCAFLLVE